MGLLEQVIGNVIGGALGGRHGPAGGGGLGDVLGGMLGGGRGGGGALSSPIVKALLMLLASRAASGGLGGMFGGNQAHGRAADDSAGELGGGLGGGFGGDGADFTPGREASHRGDGPFGEFAGMLDGPGGARPELGGGQYANLDREQEEDLGGLGDLMGRFQRGGFGDVMGSWVGRGPNREIAPNQLAEALGPDTVDNLARETGLERGDLLGQLSRLLPEVVDRMTPHGRAPTRDEMRGW